MDIKNFSITSHIENTPNSHVLDFDEDAPLNLPDIDILTDQIIEILEYIDNNNLNRLREADKEEFGRKMEVKFNKFSNRYNSVFLKIISGDDITPLLKMLQSIGDIKSGAKSSDVAEKEVGDVLRNHFVTIGDDLKNKKKL